jgi:predicted nucleic acid-binding protein
MFLIYARSRCRRESGARSASPPRAVGQRQRADEHAGAPGILRQLTHKILRPLSGAPAREVVRNYARWVRSPTTRATVIRASEIGEAWKLSFWDSMIVAAAEQTAATELLTEDLNHGQVVAGIRIRNPFIPD